MDENKKDDLFEANEQENDSESELERAARDREAAKDAARERQRREDEYGYSDMKETYEPDIHDVSGPPVPKLNLGKILKYVAIGLVLLVYMLIFVRIYYQNDTGLKSTSALIANSQTVKAYNSALEKREPFKVYSHPLSSHYSVLSVDENGNPVETTNIVYDNYSQSKEFYGMLQVSNFLYYETSEQVVITVRYNREAVKTLKSLYKTDTLPSEPFFFTLDDGKSFYDSYSYTCDSRFTYTYRRLIFNGVSLDDIEKLSLNVYYSDDVSQSAPLDFFLIYHKSTPLTEVTKGKEALSGVSKDIVNISKD